MAKAASNGKSTEAGSAEQVARAYFDALTAQDPDAMAAHWHEDGVEDIVPLGIFRGPDGVRSVFTELFAAVPDFAFTVQRVLADDRVAVVEWRATGTFDGGSFNGIEPTGSHLQLRGTRLGRGRGRQDRSQHRLLRRRRVRPWDRHAPGRGLGGRAGDDRRFQHPHEAAQHNQGDRKVIVLVTLTVGLVVWLVAWAFGIKAFDAFLFTALISFLAAAVQIVLPYVHRMLTGEPASNDG